MSAVSPLPRRAALAGFATALVLGAHAADAAATRTRRRHAAPAVLRRPAAPLPLVVLDPGHGGKDPGAIGVGGTYEKLVAISAATELRDRINAGGRQRCVLTRDDDRFIPLADRVAIAERHGAALFMSMHADSLGPAHAVRGASVYTLATGASDPVAAALARRENSADRFAGPRVHGTSPAVARILADLLTDATRAGSADTAGAVVDGLADARIGLLPNPSRRAAFVVLQSPTIPSVLVEMGFMSNPDDERLLRTRAHRDRITLALARAVDGHFARGDSQTRLAG